MNVRQIKNLALQLVHMFQKKKADELMQALVHEPEVLFLDEPTLRLDVAARKKIWEHISALRKRGDDLHDNALYGGG